MTTTDVFWEVLGRFHPLLVHFPIALILLAALLEAFWYVLGRRDHPSPVAAVCLWFGLISGGLSLWAGWVLADDLGQVGDVVMLHRWTAVATVGLLVLASAALLLRQRRGRGWAGPHVGLLMISAVLMGVSAHFGGEMAWGEGWVFGPLRAADRGWGSAEPILVAHCQKCHGPKRQKSGLQVIPWEKLFEGDRSEWVVQPGDAAASTMHQLITKPTGDEDIMPPAEKGEPLSTEQIQTLTDWINAGALGPQGQRPPVATTPAT